MAGQTDQAMPRPSNTTHSGVEYGEECCCGNLEKRKNLVVCIDGTGKQFGTKNSNVVEFYSLLDKGVDQRTWYNSGIGAYATPSHMSDRCQKFISNNFDAMVAWSFQRLVCAAYRWLSDHYEKGDHIFIIGFSRGAYQARVISAMIDTVGLIHKGNELQIPFAYDLYRRGQEDKQDLCKNFKQTFSHENARVHFVGAWDTVSSIGLFRRQELLPGTANGMKHVCYFRHALALDECRVKFLPEYASEGVSAEGENADQGKKIRGEPQVKEVWFAGTHSDIGGGNVRNVGMSARRTPPLRWMASEARKAGLSLRDYDVASEGIRIVESLIGLWWILEYIPFRRLNHGGGTSSVMTYWPHRGLGRVIRKGQKMHVSILRAENGYKPKADCSALTDDGKWETVRDNLNTCLEQCFVTAPGDANPIVEFNEQDRILLIMVKSPDELKRIVEQATTATINKEGLVDSIFDMFKVANVQSDDAPTRMEEFLRIAVKQMEKPLPSPRPFCLSSSHLASKMLEDGSDQTRQFLAQFTCPVIKTVEDVNCVKFSPNGTNLYSVGSFEGGGKIYVWDALTGQDLHTIETRLRWITWIAFSPDGEYCAVVGRTNDVHVWETKKDGVRKTVLRGHATNVFRVEWDGGGKRIVSGSVDGMIRIWDWPSGSIRQVLRGHTGTVWSFAFSPDGAMLVSGSADRTVRTWDVESGRERPGKSSWDSIVRSIAYAPDATHVVWGRGDGVIQFWKPPTMETREKKAHTQAVNCLCFSPNSRVVASASADGSIRIWSNAPDTVGMLVKDLGRDLGAVESVAFSPDGRRIVSGGRDKSIRVWPVEDPSWGSSPTENANT